MTDSAAALGGCLVCQRPSAEVPLIAFRFRDADLWICPQHLPVLIHDPGRLVGILPGAEGLEPADHHD
jgi:hypothetical protein